MSGAAQSDPRRRLPSVERVLEGREVRALVALYGHELVLRHARLLLEGARSRAAEGDRTGVEGLLSELPQALARRLEEATTSSLRPVINATGVVIHTNLGRAPLPAEAAARVARLAAVYTNLELDLAEGERGDREIHAERRLREMLAVGGAVVTNNNAAAVLLAVNTLAEGREVLVSRGELVEIGGSFRIPDVLRKGGARLREVGTTNRTRISDYAGAVGPGTAMVLKVHPSNFRVVGFTEAPRRRELAELARGAGVPLVEDLGSGLLAPVDGLKGEPVVGESLREGADLVTFSGDKLLGGPQAGLAVGRRDLVDAMRRNPLYRALRVDKMTLAALDAVLAEHEAGRAPTTVPVLRMLALSADDVRRRAVDLAERLRAEGTGLGLEIQEGCSAVGGGAAPGSPVPTALLAVTHPSLTAATLARELREGRPAVVARVVEERVVLDLRTVLPDQEPALLEALRRLPVPGGP